MIFTYKLKYILYCLVLLIIEYLFYSLTIIPTFESLSVLGFFGILQLYISVYSWKKLTLHSFVPYTIFLFAAYIFTFGQSFLYPFNKVPESRDMLMYFAINEIFYAQILTLLFLNSFHIGALISISNRKIERIYNSYLELEDLEKKYLKKIGLIFSLISLIPFLLETYFNFQVIRLMGYGGLYQAPVKVGMQNITSVLANFFIPGLLCLLFSLKNKQRVIILLLLVLYSLMLVFLGMRSDGVVLLVIILLFYHLFIKRIKVKGVLLISVFSIFFMGILSVIAYTRDDASVSMIEALTKANLFDSCFDAISEMGGSMQPLVQTIDIIPDKEGYRYGTTYLYALTTIIPNLNFWDIHPAKLHAEMSVWLQNALGINYGPGFSIAAEAYANGGVFGFIFMLLLGYIYGGILNISGKSNLRILPIALSFIFLFLATHTVRNSFISIIRTFCYHILPIYLYVRYKVKQFKDHKSTIQ